MERALGFQKFVRSGWLDYSYVILPIATVSSSGHNVPGDSRPRDYHTAQQFFWFPSVYRILLAYALLKKRLTFS